MAQRLQSHVTHPSQLQPQSFTSQPQSETGQLQKSNLVGSQESQIRKGSLSTRAGSLDASVFTRVSSESVNSRPNRFSHQPSFESTRIEHSERERRIRT